MAEGYLPWNIRIESQISCPTPKPKRGKLEKEQLEYNSKNKTPEPEAGFCDFDIPLIQDPNLASPSQGEFTKVL